MIKLSEGGLGNHAMDLQAFFQRELEEQDIAGSIIERYTAFCKTPDARRLGITQRPITAELRLRLRFECQCFCTYCACCACCVLPRFIQKRRWLFRAPNWPLIERFHGALAAMLIKACSQLGTNDLREISLTAIEPKLLFGFGDKLDPLNRLEEYRKACLKKTGNEGRQFAKRIGMSLDAPHYPLLEMIGLPLSIALFRFTNAAVKDLFLECS